MGIVRFLKTSSVFCFVLFLLSGCSTYSLHNKNTERIVNITKNNVALAPAGSFEECIKLTQGQSLKYKFSSTKPVDFNIHYHEEEQAHYPVFQNEITESDGYIDAGNHQTKNQEYYCLMWGNPDMRTINISFECVVREKHN